MPFGQIVTGPPGSGKSTYCHGMFQFLTALGRKPVIVNLDFANDQLPYPCAINVQDFLRVERVMEERGLGPNGALMFCMERLLGDFEWLEQALSSHDPDAYFLFDCPGQVELFICESPLQPILDKLARLHFRLTSVHLVDAFHCIDPAKFVAVLILSLQTMLRLGLPHVNLLSKLDLLGSFGQLVFSLEQLCEPSDLAFLLDLLEEHAFAKRHQRLSQALCELVEDCGMISFIPMAVEDKECMAFVLQEVDRTNGFVFGGLTAGNESIMESVVGEGRSRTTIEYLECMSQKYL